MTQVYTPRPYGQMMTDFILDTPRCNLFVFMGAGKTVTTLTAIDIILMLNPAPVLVLGPLRVARDVWPYETQKWQHLQHLEVSPIIGDVEARRAALARVAPIYTMNYDNLTWLENELKGRWPYQMVVLDEVTRVKSLRSRQGGSRAMSLLKMSHRKDKITRQLYNQTPRWVNLTGTPAPNGLQDLWGPNFYLDQGARLGSSFAAFQKRWFQAVPGGGDYQTIKPLAHAQGEIQEKLSDITLSLDARDWFDIQAPIVKTIEVILPPKARELYKRMETTFFAEIGGFEIEAFNAAAKSMKCLQLAAGFLFTDDKGSYESVHDAKIEALASVMEEASGMPVLCAYHFKPDLARILKAFPKARQIKTKQDENDWNAGKIALGLAHPASLGHGVSLQDGGNIICYFSHWWALEARMQILERIGPVRQLQSGYNRPVFVYNLVAKRTLDEAVLECHTEKRAVQDVLLDYLRRR